MNMSDLHNVTPIKLEATQHQFPAPRTPVDGGYLTMQPWNTPNLKPTTAHMNIRPKPSVIAARKALFDAVTCGKTEQSTGVSPDTRSGPVMQRGGEGSYDPDCFSDIWSNLSQTEPIYAFDENNERLSNSISIDLLSEFQQFEPTTPGSDANGSGNQAGNTDNQGGNEGSYQCIGNFPSVNPTMRQYSTDMTQQNTINQHQSGNMQNSVTSASHHINQHNLAYHSTSPNTGDAPNSTQNSPFAPSPCGGYEYPTSPPIMSSKATLPPSTDYPGDWDFQINFGEATESAPKSAQYTYSPVLNKLFVKMNVTCPIKFKCSRPAPNGCVVRVIPVFKRPEHVTDLVTRCPNHKIPDEAQGMVNSRYLVRAEMPGENQALYGVGIDGRENVAVMLERPQIGAEYTTVLYKFMCLSSCVGGINRRPLNVVFNLENAEGQIIGRRVVEVRVCSCPGRDRSQEEKRKRSESGSKEATKRPYKSLQGTMNIMQTSAKRKCMMAGGDDQEEFTLKIRGRDKFEMLKKIKEALDIAEVAAQQQMETYREEEPRQNLPSSSTTPPSDIKSSPNLQENPPIASTFTVSNPITPDSQGFSLTPTHSSHPLTATPNLDLPTGNSPYWSVDADMGCDVPDTNQPSTSAGLTQWAEQPNTDCTPRLVRDLSGLSTTSSLSSSQMNSSGRFVTRVTLRQRVTLNQEPTTDFWKPVIPNASEATNGVKVERKDDVESPPITGEESFEFL